MEYSPKPKKERLLSKAEQIRCADFERLSKELLGQGYQRQDLTIGVLYANVMALVVTLPLLAVLLALASLRTVSGFVRYDSLWMMLLVVALVLVLIVIHELIHGFVWSRFAENGWKSISFGFILHALTPYCTCREPLHKKGYILGALAPLVLLGLLPALLGIALGNSLLFLLGLLLTLGGGGDLLITLKLLLCRSDTQETICLDHPCECGLVLFTR